MVGPTISLAPEQIEFYRRTGYLALPQLTTALCRAKAAQAAGQLLGEQCITQVEHAIMKPREPRARAAAQRTDAPGAAVEERR